ncbi:MAG: hypothetical protein AAFR52_16850 [Pseudomonadota bacterium]
MRIAVRSPWRGTLAATLFCSGMVGGLVAYACAHDLRFAVDQPEAERVAEGIGASRPGAPRG